jgi:hypothetical protein
MPKQAHMELALRNELDIKLRYYLLYKHWCRKISW